MKVRLYVDAEHGVPFESQALVASNKPGPLQVDTYGRPKIRFSVDLDIPEKLIGIVPLEVHLGGPGVATSAAKDEVHGSF